MFEESGRYISPNDNRVIWKYLSIDKIETFLSDQNLYLTRADRFDKYLEAVLSISDYEYFENTNFKDIREFTERTKEFTFINCWCANDFELRRMWDEYVPLGKGIAIRSTVHKLKDQIRAFNTEDRFHLAQVEYFDPISDPLRDLNTIRVYSRKIRDYIHEREIRIICQPSRFWNNEEKPNYLLLPFNPSIFIDEIVLSPKLIGKEKERIELLIKKIELEGITRESFLDL